ncbi:MAG: hypothetical protein GXP34_09925 [Actinobacteria bacterium]|nr:hypothetical protein [Actinomycetota bacterium]
MTRASVPRRLSIAITVAAVVLSACSSVGNTVAESTDSESQANVAVFCRVWPDAREKLLGMVTGELTIDYQETDIAIARFLTDVDTTVPTELRPEWNRVFATYQTISDLLFITGYSEGTIRGVHLTMAFGDAGPEAAVADTQEAVAVIDDWAVTECGDFFSRWPELERILGIDDPASWSELRRDVDRYEAALTVGERLVPDEIARYWDIAVGYQRSYFEFARSVDFDPNNLPEGEEGDALFVEFVGVPWDEAHEAVHNARERISAWVEANPGTATVTAGTSGGPGSLTVRIMPQDHLTNRTLLLALLPPGTDFATVRSGRDYVAAGCPGVGSPEEEEWQAEAAVLAREEGVDPKEFLLDQMGDHFSHPLLPIASFPGTEGEYVVRNVCSLMSHEAEPALVPGGTYELFVGAYYGEPGSYGVYLSAPDYCLQFPVTVDGDTVVDLPELEPCELDPIGKPEEIARRTLPPFEPGGTLRVEVDMTLTPEGFEYCGLTAVLLPTGTTLNDLGRGDAWPSGTFSFGRHDPRDIEEGDEKRWARMPGLVPILPMPPSGSFASGIGPDIRPDGPWDTRFPEPVALVAGSYDLRIEENCGNEAEGDEDGRRRCAFVAVEVKGATIVKMPELGACP